ncbi:hypothetical protein Dimus_039284 [Dionaea muscipula]
MGMYLLVCYFLTSRSILYPFIFLVVCYVRDIRPHFTKLDPKSLKCIFLGYSRTQKGYRCYSPELGRFCISADVAFDEATSFSSSPSGGSPSESSSSVDDLLICELVRFPSSSPPVLDSPPTPDSPPVPASPSIPTSPLVSLPAPLRVYSRRPRQGVIDQIDHRDEHAPTPVTAPLPATLDSDPSPLTMASSSAAHPSSPPSDLDLPIALRKGQRSCLTYSMSTHLSYAGVSSSLQAFVSALDSIFVPRSLAEALSSSGWHQAMPRFVGLITPIHSLSWPRWSLFDF